MRLPVEGRTRAASAVGAAKNERPMGAEERKMANGHRHRKVRESGPQCCGDGVWYDATCSCGAERRTCSCTQCREQGTNDSGWAMPVCGSCHLQHAADVAGRPAPEKPATHREDYAW